MPDGLNYYCKECKSAMDKKCREENKERYNEYYKKYRKKNKDRVKAREKKYREKNKEHRKDYAKKWRERNKDYTKEYRRGNLSAHRRHTITHKYGSQIGTTIRLYKLLDKGKITEQEAKKYFDTLNKKETINKLFSIKLNGADNG